MVVGVVAAARLAGVSRATINRYYKAGKLSFTIGAAGERLLDTAELERVFGPLQPPATSQQPPQQPLRQPGDTVAGPAPDTSLVVELRRQVERLGVELEEERRERRQLAERLWELQQKFTRLLTADPTPSTTTTATVREALKRTVRVWADRLSA